MLSHDDRPKIAIPTLVLIDDKDPHPPKIWPTRSRPRNTKKSPGNHTTVVINPDRPGTTIADFLDSMRITG